MNETYEPKETAYPTDTLIIAVKTGKCDICKTRKKILLLRYGFSLCEDCLSICTSILEELNSETIEQKTKETSLAQIKTKPHLKNAETSVPKTNANKITNSYPKMQNQEA